MAKKKLGRERFHYVFEEKCAKFAEVFSNCSKAILVLLICDAALYYIFYPDACDHRTVHKLVIN